jgi:hypothetical protein
MDFRTDAHRRKDKLHARSAAAVRRIAPRAAVVACLVLLGALTLAVPADAGAGIGKYRVGIVTGPPVAVGDLKRMAATKIRHARITFSWDAIETKPPTGTGCAGAQYEGFERYDVEMVGAGKKRINVLPVIFDSPDYVGRSHRMPSTGNSKAINAYKCFLRKLVHRYGRGGALVREKKAARPITEWQLWNEPSLPVYAPNKKPNPAEYARFVKISSTEINRIDRKAKIVLGGLPERTKSGMPINKFLKRFYRVKGIEKKFDVVALHPYAASARGVKGALQRLRGLLRRVGDRRQVIWITEVGFGTGGEGPGFLVVSEKAQARKLKGILRFLKRRHDRYNVGTVDWFRWRDVPKTQKTDAWPNHAGIYRKSGKPKPACHKYRRFTGARGRCKRIVDEQQQQTASILEVPEIVPSNAVIPSPPPE